MDILRFFTAGNVDDGKSTLIGRLLFDSDSISTDIIETITRQSKNKGKDTDLDLALLTDGLRAEREQGITIDVAYKYFSTAKRKFIIADTPGHIQYTRNMFTGASTADVAIILIDIVNGITEQTRRHSIIASILGIPNVLICINKMDLVGYSENTFVALVNEYKKFASGLNLNNIEYIPVSALEGENIINPSEKLSWFQGLPLLTYLENIETQNIVTDENARFQTQYVSNFVDPKTNQITRRFIGRILSGTYKKGDLVAVLPEKITSSISSLEKYNKPVEKAQKGDIVAIQLSDDIDAGRGKSIVPISQNSTLTNEIEAAICWMDNLAFKPGQKLIIQHLSHTTKAKISEIIHKTDIHTNQPNFELLENIALNEICKVNIRTAEPIAVDTFAQNRTTGIFILIDENTNNTVAAGTISSCCQK
jgi:sulfate adenylyltransferase subunit 1